MKKHIFKLFLLTTSLLLFFSCQVEELNNKQVNQTVIEEIFLEVKFATNEKGEILEEIPTEILKLLLNKLENNEEYEKINLLKNTYNFSNGKLTKQAKEISTKNILTNTKINFSQKSSSSTTSNLRYRAHVSRIGWMPYVSIYSSSYTGTTGQRRRMEALNISDSNIKYRAHVSRIGWMPWKFGVYDGSNNPVNYVGTTGRRRRMEAVELSSNYGSPLTIFARAHVSRIGWMPWKLLPYNLSGTVVVGTTGQGRQMEAFQMNYIRY